MGRRGPAPTPTGVLEKRGSRAASERQGSEPTPPPGKPNRRGLVMSKKAARIWDRLGSILYEMGVLKISNEGAFMRYCEYSAAWRDALALVRKHGLMIPVIKMQHQVDGSTKPVTVGFSTNPAVKLSTEINAQLSKFDAEFGLTPASRARLTASVPKDALKERAKRSRGSADKSQFFGGGA